MQKSFLYLILSFLCAPLFLYYLFNIDGPWFVSFAYPISVGLLGLYLYSKQVNKTRKINIIYGLGTFLLFVGPLLYSYFLL